MTALTLRRLRLVASFGFFFLVAVSVAVTFAALQTQSNDALVINLAGRQRMLIQTMMLEVLGVQADSDPLYREQLKTTESVYFEQTLAALIAGGEAPYDEEMAVTLPPTRNPEILAQLEIVRAIWGEMDPAIHTVLMAEPDSAEMAKAVATVERLSPVVLVQMHDLVHLYENEAVRKVAQAQAIQIGFLTVAVVLLVVTFLLTERWVLHPIAQLGAAAQRIGKGDLDTPVSVGGPKEIDQLAHSFDEMRLNLANEQHNTALLYHLSLKLASNLDPEEVANCALQAASNAMGVSRGNILTVENNSENMRLLAVTGYDHETVSAINQRLNWTTSQGVCGRIVQTRTAAIVPDVSRDPFWVPIPGLDDWVKSMVSVPLITGDVVVGVLNLLNEEIDFFKTESLPLITAIASPVALALQNARLYESLRQRFKELEILADTSSALRKAQSYNDIPPILLAKAVEGLKANAGVLLLLDNDELKFVATHGAISVSKGGVCPPNTGMMRQVLNSGKPLFIPDVTQIEELHKSAVCQALMGDALSCACVPLQTTTSVIGVVFLNWMKKSFLSADESRLLESLAEIAANAIYRSTLHLQTVQQAQELTQAYDATIEGWSRALDLRDRETEGHSQRVTNLTLQLAQAIGVSESELEHIRRGALLHDIGKMGIPDNILRKAGALSNEEWTLMRRHPQLAHEMLSPITYLQTALDIPYCHHEKWDGSGYPRELKGEEIPLVARIFAVVDVFDALTSDRPYRPAWTKRKATAYIRQQAGLHFDPKVVDIFLKMIRKK